MVFRLIKAADYICSKLNAQVNQKNTLNTYKIHIAFAFLIALIFAGCSQESNSFVSRTYHNLTARDNAYFLGRERMKELENELETKEKRDYNKVLFPLITIDTNETKAYKDKTDDIITKASFPIYKHKNSNYVDKSYLLVGKSRVLRGEWKLAADTYRYVVNDGKTNDDKHQALIQLQRFFMLKKDFKSAGIVAEHIQRKPLNEDNKCDFFLTQAQYYRRLDQYEMTRKNIELAIPLMKGKKEKRAKQYFILGQIYQLQGKDSAAYENYKKTIKNNPAYELYFYAKLYMNQTAATGSAKDKKKIDKYFKKLLKDKKNEEYKDKIYYEMALFEYKQKNYPKALDHLNNSVQNNKGNKYQKGSSYLKSGKIHYDHLKNYETAKLFYDSTMSVWDPNDPEYPEIKERQKVLDEFVKNLLIVRREDSLQRLSRMDTTALKKHIDKVVALEKSEADKKQKIEEAKKKAQEQKQNPVVDNVVASTGSTFYFDNPTAISRGTQDFKKKWGTRKLEPNWRRSTKEVALTDDPGNKSDTVGTSKVDSPKEKPTDYAKYMQDIPRTQEQLVASDKKIQEGMLQVGKIAKLKLNEPDYSIETLEKLLNRYPENEKNPEVLYTLYLLYKEKNNEPKAEEYKNRLITQYPKSEFARFVVNPKFREEDKKLQREIAASYEKGYDLYVNKYYKEADSLLAKLLREYPSSDINDKIQLLRILITGETKNVIIYKQQLEEFIKEPAFATRPTNAKARQLLATAEEHIKNLNQSGKEVTAADVKYSTNTSKPHLVVLVYSKENFTKKKVAKTISDYNKKNYSSDNLEYTTEELNDSTIAIAVRMFDAMYPSKKYHETLFTAGISQGASNTFYISEDNYRLFRNDRNVQTYLKFFRENY